MLKKKNNNQHNLLYIVLFIFMVLFILFYRSSNNKTIEYKSKEDLKNTIINDINKITDNYSLFVTLYNNEEEYKLDFMTDSIITMYSSDTFPKTGYLVYNDKYYELAEDKLQRTKTIDINNIFHERYYNINIIKSILNKCEYDNISLIRAKCILNLKDFFDEYEDLNDKKDNIEDNENIELEILYDDTKIRNIKIDYGNVTKYIDDSSNHIIYDIDIDDVGTNDFSKYISYIENIN